MTVIIGLDVKESSCVDVEASALPLSAYVLPGLPLLSFPSSLQVEVGPLQG